jgi:lipid A disaccharide synthetase
MKYYIIAGEASGDLHGSNLMKELKKIDTQAEFRFWGGDLMENQGGKLVKHFKDLAFMGFIEVIKNLPTIFKNINFCKKDILQFKPDKLILIDYPGFNLRIANFAKKTTLKSITIFLLNFGHGNPQEFIRLKKILIRCMSFCRLKKNGIKITIMLWILLDIH